MKKLLYSRSMYIWLLLALSANVFCGKCGTITGSPSTNYFDVRFDFASREEIGTSNGTRILVRRITNREIIFGLLPALGLSTTNLPHARLFNRYISGDNPSTVMILKIGPDEYEISQYVEITYPQTPGYVGVISDVTAPSGLRRRTTQRIMRLALTNILFDVQGFYTETALTRNNLFHTRAVGHLAGGGRVASVDGTMRDGVMQGTFVISGPVQLSERRAMRQ